MESQQPIYQPSVRYEIWLIIKKWFPRFFVAFIVFIILYEIAKRDALFLAMNFLGFMIALPPAYWLISRFFKVDYFVFLLVDLEKMELTPYFIPKKLIYQGKWEIEGVKTAFRSYYDHFRDTEIDRVLREIDSINADIKRLEEERQKILKGTPLPRGLLRRFKKTIISEKLKEIDEEISYLKREKNILVEELAWKGIDGTTVYVCDKIDKANKKIILSPLHGYSNFELALNTKKFDELKELLKKTLREYAKMKIDYDLKVTKEAADVLIAAQKIEAKYMPQELVEMKDDGGSLYEEED